MASRKAKAKQSSAPHADEKDLGEEEEGSLIEQDPEDIGIVSAVEPVSARRPGYGEYEINIEDILRQTLPGAFLKVDDAPLQKSAIEEIPAGSKGAYLLFHANQMVYAGKTDTRHGFPERLRRHSKSVQQRKDLDPDRMTFKALRIMVFSAFDVEAILIAEMRRLHTENLTWNDSGFGSNDPGRKRDNGEPANFDRWFPIDVDLPLWTIEPGEITVKRLLKAASSEVPYKLRVGRLSDYGDRVVIIPDERPTMRSILIAVIGVLPPEFQVTIFHGRVILYRENTDYEFALDIMRGLD